MLDDVATTFRHVQSLPLAVHMHVARIVEHLGARSDAVPTRARAHPRDGRAKDKAHLKHLVRAGADEVGLALVDGDARHSSLHPNHRNHPGGKRNLLHLAIGVVREVHGVEVNVRDGAGVIEGGAGPHHVGCISGGSCPCIRGHSS